MTLRSSIRLGAEEVPYELDRSDRRTLGITVQPDGTVSVAAPQDVGIEAIEARLRKRGAWVLKTRREFDRLRPRTPERRYVAGETHRFLGRQYRLRIDPLESRGVRLTHDHIVVGDGGPDGASRIRIRLDLWYQREARRIFTQRLDALAATVGLASSRPRLVVRPLEKRWGSLSASGRSLILNRRLVEADIDAIDFVIMHELCHITHHHHGEEFYHLLTSRMPDWARRKASLERWML